MDIKAIHQAANETRESARIAVAAAKESVQSKQDASAAARIAREEADSQLREAVGVLCRAETVEACVKKAYSLTMGTQNLEAGDGPD